MFEEMIELMTGLRWYRHVAFAVATFLSGINRFMITARGFV